MQLFFQDIDDNGMGMSTVFIYTVIDLSHINVRLSSPLQEGEKAYSWEVPFLARGGGNYHPFVNLSCTEDSQDEIRNKESKPKAFFLKVHLTPGKLHS